MSHLNLKSAKKIVISFIFLIGASVLAQNPDNFCLRHDTSDSSTTSYESDIDENEPFVVNVFFWTLRDYDNAALPGELDEEKALEAVQYLNINFNEHNIFFKYKGIDIATSPDPNISWSDLDTFNGTSIINTYNLLVDNGYINFDAVDIYVPRESSFGGSEFSHSIFLNTFALDDLTLPHEMGHALDLKHPFRDWIDHNDDGSVNTSYTECEHVTRDMSDTDYNADTTADEVTDTAATPDFNRE